MFKTKKYTFTQEKVYFYINDLFGVTPEQHIFVNNSWMKSKYITIGDKLLNHNGEYETVSKIEKYRCSEPVYDLLLNDDSAHTYFADGYLVYDWSYSSNKWSE